MPRQFALNQRGPKDGDTLMINHFAGLGQFTIAAGTRSQIHDHASRLQGLHHFLGQEQRCRFAGNERGGDHQIRVGRLFAEQLVLGILTLLAHLFGVATDAFTGFF